MKVCYPYAVRSLADDVDTSSGIDPRGAGKAKWPLLISGPFCFKRSRHPDRIKNQAAELRSRISSLLALSCEYKVKNGVVRVWCQVTEQDQERIRAREYEREKTNRRRMRNA